MEVIFNFFHEINDFLNQFIKISNNQLSWFALFVLLGEFVITSYQMYFRKKTDLNFDKFVKQLTFLRLFFISVMSIVVANNGFTSKVFTIEVFISLVSTALIQIVMQGLTIFDKKNADKGIYYRLGSFLYLIPVLLLVVYFPLFTENKFLLVLFVIIYLIKIIFEIYEYKLHRDSKWAYLDFKTRLTNYDQQRNEKLRNNITKYKKNNDYIFRICMYSLWTCIPGFWMASFFGFLTVLSMALSHQSTININSINNRNTFMTESKPAFNMLFFFCIHRNLDSIWNQFSVYIFIFPSMGINKYFF